MIPDLYGISKASIPLSLRHLRTPGDLDEASQRRVVDLFIEKGANGLTALGVTGEVARLEEHERATVLEIVVKQAAGRVPIIAGTSAEGTRTCIALHAAGEGSRARRR